MPKIFITTLFFFLFWFTTAQSPSFCDELTAVASIVEESHYSPNPLNDSLSKNVFTLFLKAVDENNRFFTEEDIAILKRDQYQLDDYIKDKNCDFINSYATIFKKRIDNSKHILESLRHQTFDYSGKKDSLNYSEDTNIDYFETEEAVERYWNKKVRFRILRKMVETDSVLSNIEANFKTLEQELKSKIIDNEICLLNEIEHSKNSVTKLLEATFLDAFLKYQDPNSAYFNASTKSMFEQSVSNSQLSFGISTEKNKTGDIIISYITPGSSAFKQGEFEVNDVILTLENTHETLETYCMSNESILEFINNANYDVITFKIKKQNGQIKSIKLVKDLIDIESNSITAYIIEGKTRIGYISISSFYTDLESYNGLGVSNDVAKQIYKLQKENIAALILDLRFNGGGSMKEAADLSGMFIDRGPLAISKRRNEDNYTIRDPNRGTIFSMPIVVLVNQFSASASEFFTAALQDYNRAIIVGSPTHGKATSQVILPIQNDKNSNFVKLTISQFFRVTGKSHQQVGVIPDIILPSIYDNFETQETYKEFVISNLTIPVTLKHKPQIKQDIDAIKASSDQRVSGSSLFNSISTLNTVFVNDYVKRRGTYPLNLNWVFNDNINYNSMWSDYETLLDNNPALFSVNNSISTTEVLEYNEEDRLLNTEYRNELAKDPYLQEAYFIINDLIKL